MSAPPSPPEWDLEQEARHFQGMTPYDEETQRAIFEAGAWESRIRLQDSSNETVSSAIDPELARIGRHSEQFRVGVPPLQLLPLLITHSDIDETAEKNFLACYEQMLTILREEEIELTSGLAWDSIAPEIRLCYRIIRNDRSEPRLTALIEARWTDESPYRWLMAARNIYFLLKSFPSLENIFVEIIAPQLFREKFVNIIEAEHPLVEQWPSIEPTVMEYIKENPQLRKGWCAVDVLRMGIELDPEPHPVVISITVDFDLNPIHWANAEVRIRNLLNEAGFEAVQVSFSRGAVRGRADFQMRAPSGRTKIPQSDRITGEYFDKVDMSSDMGAEKYFEDADSGKQFAGPSGTFGGYLTYHSTNNEEPPLYLGLTNHHVARWAFDDFTLKDGNGSAKMAEVPAGSQLDRVDRNGMGPTEWGRELLTYESPSRRKHNATVFFLDQEIANNRSNAAKAPSLAKESVFLQVLKQKEEEKRRKIDFFNAGNHQLGCLWMTSGFNARSKHNARLDYALIQVKPHRIGSNRIPQLSLWNSDAHPADGFCGTELDGIRSCSLQRQLGQVFKWGTRTKGTLGRFNSVKSPVAIRDHDRDCNDDGSREYLFVADPLTTNGMFGTFGDSGAFVFDAFNNWVGLVHAGIESSSELKGGPYVYVTDAQEILYDLNRKAKGGQFELTRPEAER